MEPARTHYPENVVPLKIAGLQLAGRAVPPIGNAHSSANSESAFSEIESVAHYTPNSIKWNPPQEFGADPALQNEILQQPANVVVRKRRANGRSHAETPSQTPCDIVFTAPFPHVEVSRRANAAFPRV